jgi:single-stranded-DNA-specific exonuclease
MAAGLSIERTALPAFEAAFEAAVGDFSSPELFSRSLLTDGELPTEAHTVALADSLSEVIWGQGFPPPLFRGRFILRQQRVLKDAHLKMTLSPVASPAHRFEAIWFNGPASLPAEASLAYALSVNDWQGSRSVQLLVSGMAPTQ